MEGKRRAAAAAAVAVATAAVVVSGRAAVNVAATNDDVPRVRVARDNRGAPLDMRAKGNSGGATVAKAREVVVVVAKRKNNNVLEAAGCDGYVGYAGVVGRRQLQRR